MRRIPAALLRRGDNQNTRAFHWQALHHHTGQAAPVTKRNVPVHYLRPNESVWTPPAVICLDTETATEADGDNEVLSLRLWAAHYVDRRSPKGAFARSEWADGDSGEDLAHQVHEWTRSRRAVWLYAHNLHFDLTTSDLVSQLRLLKWEVTDFAVDGASPFVRMERGERHLTICDSYSWLPVRLDDVGQAVGIDKPPLPAEDDTRENWLHRCTMDVKILSSAMLTLMQWWDDNELGRWSITGGASGWNVMRHIPPLQKILINPDAGQVAADRQAIYGGRRGCWRTGSLPAGRYSELDLERAYTAVCAELPLPLERMVRFEDLPVDHPWVTSERHGIIARVLIETDTPRFPCKIDNRVWYPVGRFWTTLAGPDIAEASRLGCLRQIGAGWMHKLGRALQPWARWCIDSQRDDNAAVPAVAKITLRHWGRTTVGKWAQRGFERVKLGAAPTAGWDFTEAWNHGENVRASIVDFGGYRWQVSASGESENSYPAILAFVESYVRVAIGRAIEVIGPDAMLCCDTDGMIVNVRKLYGRQLTTDDKVFGQRITSRGPAEVIAAASQAAAPLTLREKRTYHSVQVIGPQHVMVDSKRRFAGVPASAEPDSDGKLWARLWPKLGWQMKHGRTGAFVRPMAHYLITGTYAPGWLAADGRVLPVEASTAPDATSQLVPWHATRHAAAGVQLGPDQNRALERYRYGPVTPRPAAYHPGRSTGRRQAGKREHARTP
jgi:hypothetical protein